MLCQIAALLLHFPSATCCLTILHHTLWQVYTIISLSWVCTCFLIDKWSAPSMLQEHESPELIIVAIWVWGGDYAPSVLESESENEGLRHWRWLLTIPPITSINAGLLWIFSVDTGLQRGPVSVARRPPVTKYKYFISIFKLNFEVSVLYKSILFFWQCFTSIPQIVT